MRKTTFLMLVITFMFLSSTQVAPITADVNILDHCDNPTDTIIITGSTPSGDFKFDKSEYKVAKSTCYTLTFFNAPSTEHDLKIDAVEDEFDGVYIYLASAENETMTIMTPDLDKTYKIYCSITGHESQGMKAKLIVGEGSPEEDSPGFTFFIVFASMMLPVVLLRKRK